MVIDRNMNAPVLKKMELLAPAGTLAAFEAAVEAGADAVYVGAPTLNARALSRDFTWAEIAAMIDYAQGRGIKLYVAMNSLVKEEELPLTVETLARLAALRPDALIIQDLGVYHLAKTYFPELRLHASTLLLAHNSLAIRKFADMGFARVVLARELTLREIAAIHKKSDVELEVFVHGALCFSYSGLCLFSSSLGGKSGLRGYCVQPCRRRYTWQEKGRGKEDKKSGGYFFSMNDLCALDLIPDLARAGVTSLKIEGRLRNTQYVGSVVRAYRTMLDAEPGDREALAKAREFLDQSMGRRSTAGYFKHTNPADALTPHHSGNIGIFLGKIERIKEGRPRFRIKSGIQVGDRLRIHHEKTGERFSFTLKTLYVGTRQVSSASAGAMVMIDTPHDAQSGDAAYLVDTKEGRALERRERLVDPLPFRKTIARLPDRDRVATVLKALQESKSASSRRPRQKPGPLGLWLKLDDLHGLQQRLPFQPDRVLVTLSRETFTQSRQLARKLNAWTRRLIWALPPIILEEDVDFYRQALVALTDLGFAAWQLGHLGQTLFFPGDAKISLFGDHTLNVLNSAALVTLQENSIGHAQIAVETDRTTLAAICRRQGGKTGAAPGLTVFGRMPLFTSRLAAEHFRYQQPFVSPKGERYELVRRWGATLALPEMPFSLLNELADIASLGLNYAVIDLTCMKLDRDLLKDLDRALNNPSKEKTGRRTFNYHGRLQ